MSSDTPKPVKQLTEEQILKAKQKEERRLAFESKRAAELAKKPVEEVSNKSKAELRKERRGKQEADRAAKAQKQVSQKENITKTKQSTDQKENSQPDNQKRQIAVQSPIHQSTESSKKNENSSSKPELNRSAIPSPLSSVKKDQIFVHIPKRETDLNALTKNLGYTGNQIHSSMIRIGLKMNQDLISDPTNRCIAFLIALKSMIHDYRATADSKAISRDLEQQLDKHVNFLDKCRPLSVSMRNVIRIMKSYISKLKPNIECNEAKDHLLKLIDKFMYEEIECGLNGIREHGNLKINENDVILTFGNSFLVQHILKEAKDAGKRFRVIVVDSYPHLDGKKLVEFLNQIDIDVTYVLINAISYVMKEVNKVLLEAHTLLANGHMISEMGSSQIALVAKAYNVPVLICCETYKFSERVHTDSFVFNEAVPTDYDFSNTHRSSLKFLITDQQKNANLNLLNLYYDVTPRDFISMVITEIGFLPSTAVPVIIRRNISKFQLDN